MSTANRHFGQNANKLTPGGARTRCSPDCPTSCERKKNGPLTRPTPLVGMPSSHDAAKFPRSVLCSRCSFVAVLHAALRAESSRLVQRHPKVFLRYIGVGHDGCDSLARFSGKKIVPGLQYATHFSARRSGSSTPCWWRIEGFGRVCAVTSIFDRSI